MPTKKIKMASEESEAFADLLADMEAELRPELRAYVCEGPLGEMIAHPYVHTLSVCPGAANRAYDYAQERVHRALKNSNWHSFVFAHERPYRADALSELLDRGLDIASPEFAKVAGSVWTDSENIHQHLKLWARIWAGSNGRDWMEDDDVEAFKQLPTTLKIYRGECNDGGVSWTLSPETAIFFATRKVNESSDLVSSGEVQKADVFAYLIGRGETEVIVTQPEAITSRKIQTIGLFKQSIEQGRVKRAVELAYAGEEIEDKDPGSDGLFTD